MTTEEKAKAYDEALERAKANFESSKTMGFLEIADTIVDIFPELRESEDERIRKEIISALKFANDGGVYDKHIAYLEKQKEPKHDATDAKSERVIKAARRVLNNWLDGTDCPDVSGAFVELEYAIRKYDGDEKQKESLHIPEMCKENADSFTDEDERIREFLIDLLSHGTWKKDWPFSPAECVAWLEKQKEPENISASTMAPSCWELEQKEQKPAEYIPDSVKFSEGYKTGREVGFREGVESVKPAEWSEEDEKMLQSIIKDFRAGKVSTIGQEQWLKFLRPQTKEELAKMLQDEYNKGKETGEREGYTKGYNKGYKDANESLSYHFPIMPTTLSGWGCDGTHCTNPQMDCINCPKKLTGGMFNTASSSGDTTLKAEWKSNEGLDIDTIRDWSMRFAPDIREAIESTAYHFYNIRPHWKPSEEQMEALEYVIRDYREDSCNATANYLQEILDHLKNV